MTEEGYQLKANPIIGLVGFDCSGKGTVAAYLRDQQHFECYSLSDMLREEADARGLDRKTETLIALGRELRAEHGNSVLAQKALKKLKPNTRYAIESIRHPDEVRALQGKVKFTLVAIDAPFSARLERFNSRKREGEQISIEDFAERDKRAFYSAEEGGQQVGVCMTMAQHRIYNHADVTTAELYYQVDKVLQKLERLGWDEYFLNIMDAVAKRGTCDRGMAGALIVKDRHILATGYVGSPSGLEHCDEKGHLMEGRINQDSSTSEHCIRTAHAEQNAFAQAAKHGADVRGATLYVGFEPCRDCTKLVINSGIERVVERKRYQKGELAREWLEKGGVTLEVLEDVVQSY